MTTETYSDTYSTTLYLQGGHKLELTSNEDPKLTKDPSNGRIVKIDCDWDQDVRHLFPGSIVAMTVNSYPGTDLSTLVKQHVHYKDATDPAVAAAVRGAWHRILPKNAHLITSWADAYTPPTADVTGKPEPIARLVKLLDKVMPGSTPDEVKAVKGAFARLYGKPKSKV